MSATLSIDFETRSRVDVRKVGVYRYAEDPSTDIWCMAYMYEGDEEPGLIAITPGVGFCQWPPRSPREDKIFRDRLCEHVESGGEIRAWNAQFERIIWREILGPRYGFPVPALEQFVCTAAEAAAMALPRQLKECAKVLNSSVQIADDKNKLIMQLAKPRKPTKNNPSEWWDTPEKLAELYEACKNDVRAEHAIAKRLRRLSEYEREVYLEDQRCNDRGVMLDAPLIEAAQKIVERGIEDANKKIAALTDGAVTSVTKVKQLTEWLRSEGVEIENAQKHTLRDLLDSGDLALVHSDVVSLRLETAKSSTAKLTAMRNCMCADGRARGLHLYHGAATGRDAGKLIQVQNFPKPYDPQSGLPRIKNVEQYIPEVMQGEYDLLDAQYPAMAVIAVMLRSMLRAAPGHRLIAVDFSQIEARVLAWIAEQDDLVRAFANGEKIYEPMAADIYEVPASEITKEDPRREVGKTTILGAGFQMGWKTFQKQTHKNTGVFLEDEIAKKAIRAYRKRNYKIKQFWYDIDNAVLRAVKYPGEVSTVGRRGAVKYVQKGDFLWCILPSGRPLCYALPKIERRKHTRDCECVEVRDEPFATPRADCGDCRGTGQIEVFRDTVMFMGVDSQTKQWKPQAGYGGLWTENVVQAMARDLLMAGMLRAAKSNYPTVLRVHDELVVEVPDGFGSLEELKKIMTTRPRWAFDLPVACEGWEGLRYRK